MRYWFGDTNLPDKKVYLFCCCFFTWLPNDAINPANKVYGANMGPIWGRQDPGGPHVGPMNLLSGNA